MRACPVALARLVGALRSLPVGRALSVRLAHAVRVLPALAVLCCLVAVQPLTAVAAGGVPSAVWQDNERMHRQSGLPLSEQQRDAQSAKARSAMTQPGRVSQANALTLQGPDDWRLRIREAAVVTGDLVTLGEIADPLGPIPPELWRELSVRQLWPSPTDAGKPLQVNKARLQQALNEVLGDIGSRCIVPTALAIQRGGMVLREDDLRSYVVRFLSPQMAALPGEATLDEFRLPSYIFLEHPQQRVGLETGKIVPGRITLRFVVQEMDGAVLRRVAATVFMNMWVEVPAAARPLNKGDSLNVNDITFMRVNAAHIKGIPWDGRGGPWQVLRAIGTGQTIFQADLATQAMVRKGAIVQLLYEKGNVRMSTQAECMADGEPGATIAVRNLQTKKQIYATVRDNRTVVAQ